MRNDDISLRPSAYLSVLCAKFKSNAEGAEIRKGPQRNSTKRQEGSMSGRLGERAARVRGFDRIVWRVSPHQPRFRSSITGGNFHASPVRYPRRRLIAP